MTLSNTRIPLLYLGIEVGTVQQDIFALLPTLMSVYQGLTDSVQSWTTALEWGVMLLL